MFFYFPFFSFFCQPYPGLWNTQVYSLISVLQITRPLLGDVILSKTDLRSGSEKKRRSYGRVGNNEAMSTILSFFPILYLKQQSNILLCFCSLKFEERFLSNKFFNFIFRSEMIVLTAKKDQIKYFAKNELDQIISFYMLLLDFPSAAIN